MPVLVHMDDTGRMINRKTKTDKTKTGTNPIPDPNRYRRRCPDPNYIDCAPYCQYYPSVYYQVVNRNLLQRLKKHRLQAVHTEKNTVGLHNTRSTYI